MGTGGDEHAPHQERAAAQHPPGEGRLQGFGSLTQTKYSGLKNSPGALCWAVPYPGTRLLIPHEPAARSAPYAAVAAPPVRCKRCMHRTQGGHDHHGARVGRQEDGSLELHPTAAATQDAYTTIADIGVV